MKTKAEFYRHYFETLNRKGFGVEEPSSPDYLVDITHKGKTIAFYTKNDSILKNPFLEVPEKQIEKIWQIANLTASLCGICGEKPYDDKKVQKLANGVIQINEHNDVVLACKQHQLFGYVLSTYRRDTENENAPVQRQYFYSKEEAFESFAVRSGLVDEKKLFTETELRLLHAGLIKMRIADEELTGEELKKIGELSDRIEDIIPELQKQDRLFDFSQLINAMGIGFER